MISTAGNDKAITIQDIEDAMAHLKSIPQNKDWIVVTPNGLMYVGEYEKVANIFYRNHPLLKNPLIPVFDYNV
jgi:hypothetical protein